MNESLPSRAEMPLFMQKQFEFTDCIRDPAKPRPASITAQRMAVYQRVVYNNIEDLLAHNFPVLREITPDDRWYPMVRDFIRCFRAQTPYFPKFGSEFVEYLQSMREHPEDPPFLAELAHYEWMELATLHHTASIDPDTIDPEGDLPSGIPVVTPLATRLAYLYPVHQISREFLPEKPGIEVTCIVIFRRQNAAQSVGFLHINPVTDRLLALLMDNQKQTGEQILYQLAEQIGHPEPATLVAFGQAILQQLHAEGILLGTRQARVSM